MNTCIHYKYDWTEIMIPSMAIFEKFCSTREKTIMFLISIVRVFILWRLWDMASRDIGTSFKYWFYIIFTFYLIINLIYAGIVLLKIPEYDQLQMNDEAQFIALALEQHKVESVKGEQEPVAG